MTDFQSFLFQNMEMIGLKEEDSPFENINKKATKKSSMSSSLMSITSSTTTSSSSSSKLLPLNISKNSKTQNSFADYFASMDNKSSNQHSNSFTSNNAQNKKTNNQNSKVLKNCGSISVTTTETFLSATKLGEKETNRSNNNCPSDEEDPYDLNNQEPKFIKKKKIDNDIVQYNNNNNNLNNSQLYCKKDQLFESNVLDLDTNYILSNDYDDIMKVQDTQSIRSRSELTRGLSSPESVIKFDFKSSTPIVVGNSHQARIQNNSNDEREIKSPKLSSKLNNRKNSFRNFSPCKSIFEKKTMSKASLNSFNDDDSFAKLKYKKSIFGSEDSLASKKESYSNYKVSSRIFKKFDNLDLSSSSSSSTSTSSSSSSSSTSSSDSDNDHNSSLESVLMEPFLNKFEEELLKNSKSEIIKDLSQLNNSHCAKVASQSNGKSNVFQKYIKEIKNLTLKRNSKPKSSDIYEEEDDDEIEIEIEHENSELDNKETLRNISKNEIPWQSIDEQSANIFLNSVLKNQNNTHIDTYPILFSKKGNKISQNQVKKWYQMLQKLAQTHLNKINEKEYSDLGSLNNKHSSAKITGKQYLMNKKREIFDKVSKKTSKTINDISHSCGELTKSVSKLYANVLVEDKTGNIKDKHNLNETQETMSIRTEIDLENKFKIPDAKKDNKHLSSRSNNNLKNQNLPETDKMKKSKNEKVLNDLVLEESHYVNENFFIKSDKAKKVQDNGKKSTNDSSLNTDHFYNEINEHDSKNGLTKHRARERERDRERLNQHNNLNTIKNQKLDRRQQPTTDSVGEDKLQKFKLEHPSTNSMVLQQLAEFSESSSNIVFKKNVASIANLKSPERKILYKEWFSIIKRMEKDPNFDLETLVRTRGRFTEHDKISYRDKLRCARSEPNFNTFMFSSNQNGPNKAACRNGINTAPASKSSRSNLFDPSERKLRRNFSDNAHSMNSKMGLNKPDCVRNASESDFVDSKHNKTESLNSALKLTLEKSDINKIKEILKKKDKSVMSDLSSLALKSKVNKSNTRLINQKQRINSQGIINEECEDNDNEEFDESLNENNNNHTKTNRKTNRNLNNQTSNHRRGNFRSLNESTLDNEIMEENNHHNKESNLVSKCRNMYNKSETAKAICDEMTKIKGKIGSKLKNLTHTSSRLINKQVNERPSISPDRKHTETNRNKNKISSESKIKMSKNSHLHHSNASFNLSSANSSDEEVSIKPNRTSNWKENRTEEKSSANPKRDTNHRSRANVQNKGALNKQASSIQKSVSPAKPAPPKRPPPPRPFSPGGAVYSSYSTGHQQKSSNTSSNKTRGTNENSKRREESNKSSSDITQIPKRSATNAPPRPPIPGQLPPRPPSSKLIKKSHKSEENLSDSQFYEFEIKPTQARNNKEKNSRGQKRDGGENRKKASSSSLSSLSNSRSSSLSPAPNLVKSSKQKTNNRREVSRR